MSKRDAHLLGQVFVNDPCANCGGDGFLYDDRGVPSICGSCGGSGVSRFETPVRPLCGHPGPRCTDCAEMGCIAAHAIHEKEEKR